MTEKNKPNEPPSKAISGLILSGLLAGFGYCLIHSMDLYTELQKLPGKYASTFVELQRVTSENTVYDHLAEQVKNIKDRTAFISTIKEIHDSKLAPTNKIAQALNRLHQLTGDLNQEIGYVSGIDIKIYTGFETIKPVMFESLIAESKAWSKADNFLWARLEGKPAGLTEKLFEEYVNEMQNTVRAHTALISSLLSAQEKTKMNMVINNNNKNSYDLESSTIKANLVFYLLGSIIITALLAGIIVVYFRRQGDAPSTKE